MINKALRVQRLSKSLSTAVGQSRAAVPRNAFGIGRCPRLFGTVVDTQVQQNQSFNGFARKLPSFEEEREEILQIPKSSKAKEAFEKYHELKALSLKGGGPKGVERHVNKNRKVLVRERIKAVLDKDSPFLEIGDLAGFDMEYGDVPTAGAVTGIGKVQGVFCMITGNDATVKAGSYYPITVVKSYRCQEISESIRLPTIYMPDSGGAFLPLQSEIFPDKKHGGRAFYNQAVMSSKGIHQIALVCGSCTAGAAYNPTMCDDAIIVDKIGKIYLAGPPLVKAATGEIVSDEDLGGAILHSCVSGCTDYFAKDEDEAFVMCRDIVHSLNMKINASYCSTFEEPLATLPWKEIAETRDYFTKMDLYVILSGLLDGSKFHEFKTYYGQDAIAGVGCIEGRRLGVIANVGDFGYQESLKLAHFVNLCNRRKLPLLFLQNSKQDNTNSDELNLDLLKYRGTLASQIAVASVPKFAITLSGLSQNSCLTMCGPSFQPTFHFAWPQANFTNFEMTSASDSGEPLATIDSFHAAAHMLIDRIILPSETRSVISLALQFTEQCNNNPEPKVDTGILRM